MLFRDLNISGTDVAIRVIFDKLHGDHCERKRLMATEKLVRDKIPDIIRAKGESCVTRVAGNNRVMLTYLLKKLEEEKTEFLSADMAHVLEECADMYEVICAFVELFGHTREELFSAADKKREARGGFTNRIILRVD